MSTVYAVILPDDPKQPDADQRVHMYLSPGTPACVRVLPGRRAAYGFADGYAAAMDADADLVTLEYWDRPAEAVEAAEALGLLGLPAVPS